MEYRPEISMAGQDQLDVHPAPRSALQRLQQLLIGHKVGVGDVYLAFGTVDRGGQRHIDSAIGFVRRAADGTHNVPAARF